MRHICPMLRLVLSNHNEYAELLAIGKFATPVKNRNDIDMNFLVRCDLDQDRFANIVDDNEFD